MRRSTLALAAVCFSALISNAQAQRPSQDAIQGVELAAGQKVGIYRVGARCLRPRQPAPSPAR